MSPGYCAGKEKANEGIRLICPCMLSHSAGVWNAAGCPRVIDKELNIDSARAHMRGLIKLNSTKGRLVS